MSQKSWPFYLETHHIKGYKTSWKFSIRYLTLRFMIVFQVKMERWAKVLLGTFFSSIGCLIFFLIYDRIQVYFRSVNNPSVNINNACKTLVFYIYDIITFIFSFLYSQIWQFGKRWNSVIFWHLLFKPILSSGVI